MISLRAVNEQDKGQIRQWRNRRQVASFMYTDHEISEEEHAAWFARIQNDPTCRYWVIVCDSRDVGVANISHLDRQNERCDWAFYIAEEGVRGRGVGSFVEYAVLSHVFDHLQLHKLCCQVLAFNQSVIEMHRKYGFQVEGILRSHILKEGQFVDVYYLGILRQEWEKEKPRLEAELRQKGILA